MDKYVDKKIGPETADYPAIRKLAEALWKQDATYHGAAIMVGSGFSRSAATSSDNTQKLPLWSDLSRQLAKELDANPDGDPLRLAEEYQAYFGNRAIPDLVKSSINDAAWSPGNLHKLLLELPWTDVLTTNWDTLLERASREIHQPTYTVVTRQENLAGSHAPRIVKLHGTIGITEKFTFTQEDYRKYPSEHAAFVNLARQVFIENELCLLGFSGDDPNFLQWAGWVRDQIATNARRIYLVGALGLKPARRKYLESINVSPIDLSDSVEEFDDPDIKHLRATEYFINALLDLKPKSTWDWSPSKISRAGITNDEFEKTHRDHAYGASLLEKQLPRLQRDRESYPGWLIPPKFIRTQFGLQICDPYPGKAVLDQLKVEIRPKVLFEIAWRYRMSYRPLDPWLAKDLLDICDPGSPTTISKKQQLQIAELLLWNSRYGVWGEVEARAFCEKASKILLDHREQWDEADGWLAYHQAVSARDKLDFSLVESLVGKIDGRDPVWKLRRASLLSVLGRFEEAEQLILDGYQELLRQFRENQSSVFIISRLAWAHWLNRAVLSAKPSYKIERLPDLYREFRTDPFDLIDDIGGQIDREILDFEKASSLTPNFEAGSYKDNSKTVSFNCGIPLIFEIDGLAFDAGVPMRWESVSLWVELASKALTLGGFGGARRLALIIRASSENSDKLLNRTLSRISVAQLEMVDVVLFKDRILAAVDFLIEVISESVSRAQRLGSLLNVLVEVLGRICLRLESAEGKELFKKAVKLGGNKVFQNHWSCAALARLIDNSLDCIPIGERRDIISDALAFPLQVEVGLENYDRWPNPVVEDVGNRIADAAISGRISQLIECIAANSAGKASALERLLPLVQREFLNAQELNKLGDAIWALPKGGDGIPATGLFRSVLLVLPSPDPREAMDSIRRSFSGQTQGELVSEEYLGSMVNLAFYKKERVFLDAIRPVQIFDQLVLWRPSKEESGSLFSAKLSGERYLGRLIGMALGRAVVPFMDSGDLTDERLEKLLDFMRDTQNPSSLQAVVAFHSSDAKRIEKIGREIRVCLLDSRSEYVAFSSYALLKWREKAANEVVENLVTRLIHMVEAGRSPNMSVQLNVCAKLCKLGLLRLKDVESLVESIPPIYEGLKYEIIDPIGRDAIDASLVRAACVKLAKAICDSSQTLNSKLDSVLKSAKDDALPEVRFATESAI